MKTARVWLGIFAGGFAVLVALLIITLFTPPAYPWGALTRIARVSEEAFGWRQPPPPIPMALLRAAPIDQADVLVIGDSFSMYYAWQSRLAAAGLRVATAHWDKVGPLCGPDFARWLRSQGFAGKLVLIESIERLLPERIASMRQCGPMRQRFVPIPPPGESPSQPPPGFRLNWSSPLMTGFSTWRNTREVARRATEFVVDGPKNGDMIFAAPVPDGCAQFSHRLCDRGLFLTSDRGNPELTAPDAEFLHAFSQQARPYQVSWIVIPNKTTVYLEPRHGQGFTQRAAELQIGPDLFGQAQQLRRSVIDLYWPDDTHWSMQGQLAFGDAILAAARQSLGSAPAVARAP